MSFLQARDLSDGENDILDKKGERKLEEGVTASNSEVRCVVDTGNKLFNMWSLL